MRTRITELLAIEHPILLSGMSWISTPELVAAVCNAGGLGILATGVLDAEQSREYIRPDPRAHGPPVRRERHPLLPRGRA